MTLGRALRCSTSLPRPVSTPTTLCSSEWCCWVAGAQVLFTCQPHRPPPQWFNHAEGVGVRFCGNGRLSRNFARPRDPPPLPKAKPRAPPPHHHHHHHGSPRAGCSCCPFRPGAAPVPASRADLSWAAPVLYPLAVPLGSAPSTPRTGCERWPTTSACSRVRARTERGGFASRMVLECTTGCDGSSRDMGRRWAHAVGDMGLHMCFLMLASLWHASCDPPSDMNRQACRTLMVTGTCQTLPPPLTFPSSAS